MYLSTYFNYQKYRYSELIRIFRILQILQENFVHYVFLRHFVLPKCGYFQESPKIVRFKESRSMQSALIKGTTSVTPYLKDYSQK